MNPKFVTIDEDGYFLSQGVRWTDADLCSGLLSRLKKTENGADTTVMPNAAEPVFVESFDAPLVAIQISLATLTVSCPYGFKTSFVLESLCLDEWDRFHGRTTNGIAFVMSRSCQAEFFKDLEDYDDDSITINGRKISVGPWPPKASQELSSAFWGPHYQGSPGWDLGEPHPSIASTLPQLKLVRSRILVLGAGRGHDAAALAQAGHLVTAVDFADEAIAQARGLYSGIPNLTFTKADALNLPSSMMGNFDVVFEHTCYCALDPEKRNTLVRSWRRALTDQGMLLGIFPLFDRDSGPPFSSSEWELRERLKKSFHFLYWTRSRVTTARRLGQELIIYAKRL